MPQVAAAVAALDAAHVAAVLAGGRRGRDRDRRHRPHARPPRTSPSPCSRSRATRSRPSPATRSPCALELDEELRREGLAREIVHAVQNARKEAGLEITDRIELGLGGDEALLEAAREHQAYLAGEVLATAIAFGGGDGDDGDDRRHGPGDRGKADVNDPRRAATTDLRRGFGRIPHPMRHRAPWRRSPCSLLLAAAGPASAARPKASDYPPPEIGPGHQAGPKPHLMLIHGGSFLYDDPEFVEATAEAALKAGFIPHYTTYPLGDMPAAVLAVRAEAKRLRQKFGPDMVYAYGSSAGGTLAALLSGDGLVGAAVAKAPVSEPGQLGMAARRLRAGLLRTGRLEPAGALPALAAAPPGQASRCCWSTGSTTRSCQSPRARPTRTSSSASTSGRCSGGHHAERAQPEVLQRTLVWLAEIAEAPGPGHACSASKRPNISDSI